MSHQAYIVSGVRTAIGSLGGALSTTPAPKLGAVCIREALRRAGLDPAAAAPLAVDEVIMGNVVSAGIGQNPARQASIAAGLPTSVGAFTVNKVCGSGLKAVMLAAQSIVAGDANCVVAGGMESMSLAPYLLPQARAGYRLGDGKLVDAMLHDGLSDCYGGQPMGVYGDRCAAHFGFSRQAQDEYAVQSYRRAIASASNGAFASEIVPVEVVGKKGVVTVDADEEPGRFQEEKMRAMKPAFAADGTITAGNASSINDGAAATVVCSRKACEKLGIKPAARIVGWASFSQAPDWFTTAPIGAVRRLLETTGWRIEDVDLFEINEAFAVVAMAAQKELSIPADKLNILGGAVALGHPIGASGARILVTLLTALARTGGRRGIASLCIGGGEAVAVAVERITN